MSKEQIVMKKLLTFISWEARHDESLPYGLAMAKIKMFLEQNGYTVDLEEKNHV